MNKLEIFDRAATQADQAYEALLAEILDCRLAPGAKITISDVATRLGLSPGAIREALSRLAAEKWTLATAQKGYSVTPVSADELRDLTQTRITIEQLCLNPAWVAAHTTYHAALVAGCDSPWMLNLRAMLYAQSERYRYLSFALAKENRDVDAEHERLLKACLERDADSACALIEDHLTRTSQILLTSPLLRERYSQVVARSQ
jgi:GntR family carbon starvation induced transcriptional regulator